MALAAVCNDLNYQVTKPCEPAREEINQAFSRFLKKSGTGHGK